MCTEASLLKAPMWYITSSHGTRSTVTLRAVVGGVGVDAPVMAAGWSTAWAGLNLGQSYRIAIIIKINVFIILSVCPMFTAVRHYTLCNIDQHRLLYVVLVISDHHQTALVSDLKTSHTVHVPAVRAILYNFCVCSLLLTRLPPRNLYFTKCLLVQHWLDWKLL